MTGRRPLLEILQDYRANWPEFDRPETQVMLAVIRLNDLVYESTGAVLAGFNLTPSAFEALMTLRSQPAPHRMTPTDLLNSILITSGGMTKVLRHLEMDGLVKRLDNPDDRRSRFVQLSRKGVEVAEASMEAVAEHDRNLLEHALSEQQIFQLGKVLLRTVGKLEDAE